MTTRKVAALVAIALVVVAGAIALFVGSRGSDSDPCEAWWAEIEQANETDPFSPEELEDWTERDPDDCFIQELEDATRD
jgi:hypothetical protein